MGRSENSRNRIFEETEDGIRTKAFDESKMVDPSLIIYHPVRVVEGDTVELDDIMVPELIMDMEMAVVCDEDCKGLCPKCGKDLNEGECGCNRKEVDPRLACLAALLEKPE
jgi:uncharacterized metal-binding protein YceD (DUF177 family)